MEDRRSKLAVSSQKYSAIVDSAVLNPQMAAIWRKQLLEQKSRMFLAFIGTQDYLARL
jgi:hypothetical protein